MFIDEGSKLNRSIEPKDGRVSAFTSGPENRHMVEPVTGGTRYVSYSVHLTQLHLSLGQFQVCTYYGLHLQPR